MIAEINFQLTELQKVSCEAANAAYHKVSLEANDFQYADSKEIYEALMLAWAFIGDINQDWIQ